MTLADGESALDLTRYIRSGDNVVWGQACGEPSTLTETLVSQRRSIGEIRCFVGIPAANTLDPERADGLHVTSYCGSGSNGALAAAGVLSIAPIHYSAIPAMFASGTGRADVVLVQVSAPDENGRHSMGLTDDYLAAAVDAAPVVIAEINDRVPFTFGARTLTEADWTASIRTSREPATLATVVGGDVVRRVARNAAALIDDGATLQFGIGVVPEAVLAELHDRVDLGIHSGVLNDTAMALMQSGAVNGSRKTLDKSVAVAGFVTGTRALFDYIHRNPSVHIRSTTYTHDAAVLAAQPALAALNSAVEVDLFGAVNAEVAGGRYVGAVGGAMDFLRGAAASSGGLPIVALPSTAKGRSRIVAALSGPVSTPRADAGIVVTEHGTADLRGRTLEQRAEAMLAIADPEHRDALELEIGGLAVGGGRFGKART